MTIVIQLDKAALDKLFPEGSEARVNLQAGVINAFIDKMSMRKLEQQLRGLDAQIQNATKRAVDEIMNKQRAIFKNDYFGKTLMITDAGKEELRVKIEAELSAIIRGKIDELKPQVANEVKHRLDSVITSEQQIGLSELVRKLVRDELKQRFNN